MRSIDAMLGVIAVVFVVCVRVRVHFCEQVTQRLYILQNKVWKIAY
jgi:hypothetical protein